MHPIAWRPIALTAAAIFSVGVGFSTVGYLMVVAGYQTGLEIVTWLGASLMDVGAIFQWPTSILIARLPFAGSPLACLGLYLAWLVNSVLWALVLHGVSHRPRRRG